MSCLGKSKNAKCVHFVERCSVLVIVASVLLADFTLDENRARSETKLTLSQA